MVINSSGSAMKKAAQCSCGRSAVKVNWPWRLSMSRHPGGRGGRAAGLGVPGCSHCGGTRAAPLRSRPDSQLRLRPAPALRVRHPISPHCDSSDWPLAMGIALPAVLNNPHLPAARGRTPARQPRLTHSAAVQLLPRQLPLQVGAEE